MGLRIRRRSVAVKLVCRTWCDVGRVVGDSRCDRRRNCWGGTSVVVTTDDVDSCFAHGERRWDGGVITPTTCKCSRDSCPIGRVSTTSRTRGRRTGFDDEGFRRGRREVVVPTSRRRRWRWSRDGTPGPLVGRGRIVSVGTFVVAPLDSCPNGTGGGGSFGLGIEGGVSL